MDNLSTSPGSIEIKSSDKVTRSLKIKLSARELKAFVERIRDEACGDSKRALMNVSESERILQQAYEGRFLFELIQNVRDANKEAKILGAVFITLDNKALVVSNTGAPFSKRGIDSITTIGDSPKDSKEFIGFKGIGFKSVQEISDTPQIVTASGSIYFDRKLSRPFLIGKISKMKEIPLFFIPHFLPERLTINEVNTGIVTRIVLPLNKLASKELIQNSFNEIGIHQLLLLGCIKELNYVSGKYHAYFKIEEFPKTGKVNLETRSRNYQFKHFKPNYKIKIPDWIIDTLEEKEREIYEKNPYADISLLFDLDENGRLTPNDGANLFLFYPLETVSGFPFIIHSYFIVNPERKGLRDSKLNTFLLESIADYLTGEWLKQTSRMHRSLFLDYLAFKRNNSSKILNALYDRVALNLQDIACIYDGISGKILKPKQVIVAEGIDKGLFEDNLLKNKQIVYLKNNKTIRWLIDEIGVEFLAPETIRENLEAECFRQKRKKNLSFFDNLYRYLVEHDDLNLRGLNVLLTSNWKLLSDDDQVFYGMANQRNVKLPNSIQKKIHFIHPGIIISEQRLGQGQTGFIEYKAELLVRRLLMLFDDPQVPKIDILKTLVELRVSERLYPSIREKVQLPTISGRWAKPLNQPVYLPAEQIEMLYGTSNVIDVQEVFGTEDISKEQREKMIGFGAWYIPAIYYSEKKHNIFNNDPRFQILYRINYYSTNHFELRGDWILDIPQQPDEWFTNSIIANWKKYEQLILDENNSPLKYKSQQSGLYDIPTSVTVAVTSFANTLRTAKWIALENESEIFTCKEVIAMDPGEFNQGTSNLLRRYLKTIKLHYASNIDFITALDLMHYDRAKLENWKNILSSIKSSYPDVSDESKDFISFYNKLLIKLYDFYEFSLPVNDKSSIKQLSTLNFLSQDEQSGALAWKAASKIFYLDDKPSYDLLPASVKQIVQPHFTNRDRNRFGQIARVIGISFRKSIKQELENEPVIDEMPLYNFYPFWGECLALTEFFFRVNLDKDLEKIKLTIVKIKGQVNVNLYRNNEFLEKLNLQHKVENGKIAELHIIPKNPENGPLYYANCLHDLLVELLDRDFVKLQNFLTDFLSRQDKGKFLSNYDIDPDRVQEINEKLADRIYSNEQLFWIGILQVSGINNFGGYFEEKNVLYDDLTLVYKKEHGTLSELADNIDFDQLPNSRNLPFLQAIFKLLNIEVAEFNKYAVSKVDFSEHFKRLFNGLKNKYKLIFQERLYNYLLKKTPDKQSEFQDLMDIYRNQLIFVSLKGVLSVDVQGIIISGIKKLFPYLNIKSLDFKNDTAIDLAGLFNSNLVNIKELLVKHKVSLSQLDTYNAYNKNRSLIYFGQDLNFIDRYTKWLSGITTTPEPAGNSPSDPFAGYFNPNGMVIKNTITKHSGKAAAFGSGAGGHGGGHGSGKRIDGAASTEVKDLIGLVAEKMVYEQLVKENFHNVSWVSKNAAKAKVNPEGTDDYGYDVGYIDALGNDHFIEVKGKVDNVKHFYISSPEFRKAVEENEFYHVIYVPFALDNRKREMHDLGNIFLFSELEDLFNNQRFTAKFNTLEIDFT
ncbi:sacsin N-terminal ATP-binding-like domain-containing protein [Mucilaginibacter sp. SP1R1]|uniref:sacsin N-terminal ATP-binding-like domain-containing protein n=1 Tax=Mucilaginibacter sp. SP1R1 TaxID=2723091 RepID=UPI00160E74BA|nr:DUF3883 domain-containing protein [Mucilaginibacter sp. SP1R1]MBB6150008.1 hypothetical protein [Mucilaginibacter sp. SP1R1]